MSRLIDADALKKALMPLWNIHDDQDFANKDVWHEIDNAPTVQPERMRGRWIWKGKEGDSRYSCSVCKCREHVPTCNGNPDIWQYCPNCGARMDGGEQE